METNEKYYFFLTNCHQSQLVFCVLENLRDKIKSRHSHLKRSICTGGKVREDVLFAFMLDLASKLIAQSKVTSKIKYLLNTHDTRTYLMLFALSLTLTLTYIHCCLKMLQFKSFCSLQTSEIYYLQRLGDTRQQIRQRTAQTTNYKVRELKHNSLTLNYCLKTHLRREFDTFASRH